MTGIQLANLIQKHREEVQKALAILIPEETHEAYGKIDEICGEIQRRKCYLRYIESLRELGTMKLKMAIVAICETIDEPDHAVKEIGKLMYS